MRRINVICLILWLSLALYSQAFAIDWETWKARYASTSLIKLHNQNRKVAITKEKLEEILNAPIDSLEGVYRLSEGLYVEGTDLKRTSALSYEYLFHLAENRMKKPRNKSILRNINHCVVGAGAEDDTLVIVYTGYLHTLDYYWNQVYWAAEQNRVYGTSFQKALPYFSTFRYHKNGKKFDYSVGTTPFEINHNSLEFIFEASLIVSAYQYRKQVGLEKLSGEVLFDTLPATQPNVVVFQDIHGYQIDVATLLFPNGEQLAEAGFKQVYLCVEGLKSEKLLGLSDLKKMYSNQEMIRYIKKTEASSPLEKFFFGLLPGFALGKKITINPNLEELKDKLQSFQKLSRDHQVFVRGLE